MAEESWPSFPLPWPSEGDELRRPCDRPAKREELGPWGTFRASALDHPGTCVFDDCDEPRAGRAEYILVGPAGNSPIDRWLCAEHLDLVENSPNIRRVEITHRREADGAMHGVRRT